MGTATFVYLITGFLGSGKTTLLNRVIHQFPKDRKLMILMNEFGEVGIDGTLVENEDLEMMEISKGSIFCACVKTDFVKGMYSISQEIRPDILLIESTGVANPTDLKRDLKLSIFKNRFLFKEQICVIDAAHFLGAYGAFQSIEKQLESSTLFLVNKVDTADRATIDRIKDVVKTHHPDPTFYETVYGDIDFSSIFFSDETERPSSQIAEGEPLTPSQLDEYVEALLDDPEAQVTPPDRLLSAVYKWVGKDLETIRKFADRLPPAVVRSKGFLSGDGGTYLFSYVMGDWELNPREISPERCTQKDLIVFIAPPESLKEIEILAGQFQLVTATGSSN
ncbi:MAG: GTP-binding protein [Deltaproteobacteria bacterium]|nr:GTP-binding protein [Deltaproteobacteria bacterium]